MIRVLVKYTLRFRELTRRDSEELVLSDGTTLSDLIGELSARYGEEFREEFKNPSGDTIGGSVLVVINDKVATDLSVGLRDGDRVVLTYVPFGGSD